MAARQPHIVIVGGSYAGISALNDLISLSNGTTSDDNAPRLAHKPKYTLVDERDGFYHTVGAPLGQISSPHAREFWVRYEELTGSKYAQEPVEVIRAKAKNVDTSSKTLRLSSADQTTERTLQYDYLMVATGIRRGWPVVPKSLTFDEYISDATGFESKLSSSSRIVVVGGGACGIEMAGEIKAHWPSKEVILIHSGPTVLSREPLPDEFKATALQLLYNQGVDVRLNTRVQNDTRSGEKQHLTLSNQETLECDTVIYSAVQQGANTDFLEPEALDEQGCVKVRDTLQFPSNISNAGFHYAVGDVARWPCIKRSGPAMSQARHAAANIIASLRAAEQGEEVKLASLATASPSMTLSVGDSAMSNRRGIMYGKDLKLRAFGTGLGIDGTLSNLGLRPRKLQAVY